MQDSLVRNGLCLYSWSSAEELSDIGTVVVEQFDDNQVNVWCI